MPVQTLRTFTEWLKQVESDYLKYKLTSGVDSLLVDFEMDKWLEESIRHNLEVAKYFDRFFKLK